MAIDAQWVNANDDGTYTSPGEGWREFVPTERNPILTVYSPDGNSYRLGETEEGKPRGTALQTGKVETKPEHVIGAVFIARGLIAGAVSAFNQWRKANKALKVPEHAKDTLGQIERTGQAPSGYQGGRQFRNDGRAGGQVLPKADASGKPIQYREYDVRPYQKGVNRGAERIVRGSDGSAYYTNDHYKSFVKVK